VNKIKKEMKRGWLHTCTHTFLSKSKYYINDVSEESKKSLPLWNVFLKHYNYDDKTVMIKKKKKEEEKEREQQDCSKLYNPSHRLLSLGVVVQGQSMEMDQ